LGVVGAAWIFTRSGGVWSQQGSKLVGTDAAFYPDQGASVALSADGNTAIVGGPGDNGGKGAVWVYTRSGGVWSQQGSKLVGTGAVTTPGYGNQGSSVALSADGNTAIESGISDHFGEGAAWVFTRSGGVWSQQGSKLVGTGAVGDASQGTSVALSADGNTAIIGGLYDNGGMGAAWVFARSGGVWSQQGSKLVGTGAVGNPGQGSSVALSADGHTAIVGGLGDNSGVGAVWVYTAPLWVLIKLNMTTSPSSGVTGTTYVNITGSGFPKGTVNPGNVIVDLAASCGAPPLGTTGATSVVPIIGTSDRVQFLIPPLAPGLYYVSISDLADGDANFATGNCSTLTVAGQ
jgi:hypothetical protein